MTPPPSDSLLFPDTDDAPVSAPIVSVLSTGTRILNMTGLDVVFGFIDGPDELAPACGYKLVCAAETVIKGASDGPNGTKYVHIRYKPEPEWAAWIATVPDDVVILATPVAAQAYAPRAVYGIRWPVEIISNRRPEGPALRPDIFACGDTIVMPHSDTEIALKFRVRELIARNKSLGNDLAQASEARKLQAQKIAALQNTLYEANQRIETLQAKGTNNEHSIAISA